MTNAEVRALSSCVANDPTPPAPPTIRTRSTPGGRPLIAEHRLPAGQHADRQRCSIGERELVRDLGHHSMVHGQLLRPATVACDVAGTHHPIADGEAFRRGSGADDDACELPAQDRLPAWLGAAHRTDERLARVHGDGADLDQHVVGTKLRLAHLDQFHRERVQRVCSGVGECLHCRSSSVVFGRCR